eukprot:8960302-Pyramimonas_sp.AAC.1
MPPRQRGATLLVYEMCRSDVRLQHKHFLLVLGGHMRILPHLPTSPPPSEIAGWSGRVRKWPPIVCLSASQWSVSRVQPRVNI